MKEPRLSPAHRAKLLKESTLTEQSLTALGWQTVSDEEALQRLRRSSSTGVPQSGGVWIPYPDPVKAELTNHGRVRFDSTRYRKPGYSEPIGGHAESLHHDSEKEWAEGPKYLGPAGESTRLYIPHLICPSILNPAEELWIVEGEKKAVALCQAGIAAVALPGVDNFGDSQARYESWGEGKDDRALHPDFQHLTLRGRKVVICFDSDIESNPRVLGAAARLGTCLSDVGAKVHMAYIDTEEAKGKVGLDDLLAARGHEGLDDVEASVRPFNVVLAVEQFLEDNWNDWSRRVQERELRRVVTLAQALMKKDQLARFFSKTARTLRVKVGDVKEHLSDDADEDREQVDPRAFVADWMERRKAVYSYEVNSVLLNKEHTPAEVMCAELLLDAQVFAKLRKDLVLPAYTIWKHDQEKLFLDQVRVKVRFRPVGDRQLRRWVRAVTGNEDKVDLATVAHLIWQTKRKLLGLPVSRHLMLILFNAKQGGGKTRAIQALLGPIRELVNEANSLQMLEDERQLFRLVRFYVAFFDELEKASRVDMSALKKTISAARLHWRILGLNQSESGPNNCTFIGATNKDVRVLFTDPTGMRRFHQINTLDLLVWDEINSIDYEELWASVDPTGPCPLEPVLPELQKRQEDLRAQDEVEEWLAARTTFGKEYTKASVAYADFLQFWRNSMKKGEPPSQKKFSIRLKPIIKDRQGEAGHREDGRGSYFKFTLARAVLEDMVFAGNPA